MDMILLQVWGWKVAIHEGSIFFLLAILYYCSFSSIWYILLGSCSHPTEQSRNETNINTQHVKVVTEQKLETLLQTKFMNMISLQFDSVAQGLYIVALTYSA